MVNKLHEYNMMNNITYGCKKLSVKSLPASFNQGMLKVQ